MLLTIENKNKMDMFVALFQLLKNWGSYLNIHFEENQLYIQSMDKSHICLSNIIIKDKWFSSYLVQKTTNISVDSTNFATMMTYALKHTKMEIKFEDEDDPDKLYINLSNNKSDKAKFDHFFELNLMDVEEETLGIPEVEYDVDLIIDAKKFTELISELMVFGSNLNIVCSEEVLEFNSSGDAGKLKVNVPIDDLNEFAISEGEKLDISYSLNHIGKLCLSTKLGLNVSVSISSEYPMAFKYDLGDDSSVAFYIAPKIAD